ncbi:MAG: hypothetical protein KDA60_06480 [Planctomycetales bacterium]|nr:hypothetical protein [Planctomycetales bacterium]
MQHTSPITIVVFIAYVAGVFVLAGLSHRILNKKSFLSEYFLGSRGLGTWALAFTFAATSASGGSFGGYPSYIYTYGWVLALWIASYMIFPLTTMGVIGKRINQVARISDAITIPDVFRDRFESPAIGLFSSCTIIFFTICVLVAQFKLGAVIIQDTFNLSFQYSYEVSLAAFSVVVVVYTAYGGFRAVVWTDVMQGIVMGLGVVLLIPIVMAKTGGLEQATRRLVTAPPMAIAQVRDDKEVGGYNDLAFRWLAETPPYAIVYEQPERGPSPLAIQMTQSTLDERDISLVTIRLATDDQNHIISTANDIRQHVKSHDEWNQRLDVAIPYRNSATTNINGVATDLGATGTIVLPASSQRQTFVFRGAGDLLFGPSRNATGVPFHSLGMIISFFFIWAIAGIAQPGMMVRLMAFRDSRTLKRSILTVTVYYAMIYVPLILVVMAARDLLPILTPEYSDHTIVLIATRLVADMGIGYKILGAILVAAPFAAVMSTVDSFLLMISSGAVRDIYQRSINPAISDRAVARLSYATTTIVGITVAVLALHPPDFMQKIVVFTSGGFAATFLCPVLLGLYWPQMTRQGALAAMISGFAVVLGCFLPGFFGGSRVDFLGFHPTIWGMLVSFVFGFGVSKLTGPAPASLVEKYFGSPVVPPSSSTGD